MMQQGGGRKNNKKKKQKRKDMESKLGTSGRKKAGRVVEGTELEEEGEGRQGGGGMMEEQPGKSVWRPGYDPIGDDEELDFDQSAYITYHAVNMEWPCLSIDVLRDPLGFHRTKFPMTTYLACGSQAQNENANKVYLMKVSDIKKTQKEDNDMEEDDDGESEDESEPTIATKTFKHKGAINRIRAMPQASNILATMSETKEAHIWDVQHLLQALDSPSSQQGGLPTTKPLFTFTGHPAEGYAVDWSPKVPGRLLTGDCSKHIYLWERNESGWSVDKTPFNGHSDSVEDIQWSPKEAGVFASCSVDKTIRIWDTRRRKNSMLFVAAHRSDVNVISWNPNKSHLLLSGSDDHSIKIWDLRKFKSSSPIGHFKYHMGAITSLQWHPTEDAMLAAASDDNQLTVWDLALEADDEQKSVGANANVKDIPPQLLFVHQGQTNIKELRFHPQIPGLITSTAATGLNIFKPCNL